MAARSLILLAGAAVCMMARADGLEFKGVPFGASLVELRAKHPGAQCARAKDEVYDLECRLVGSAGKSYAEVPAVRVSLNLYKGQVVAGEAAFITMPFSTLSQALAVKYGKGFCNQARRGRSCSWGLDDGSFVLLQQLGEGGYVSVLSGLHKSEIDDRRAASIERDKRRTQGDM